MLCRVEVHCSQARASVGGRRCAYVSRTGHMANQRSLAGLGNVVRADKGFKAKVETWHEGEKHKFSGPLRQNEESEQHAYEDLLQAPGRSRG